MYPYCNPTRLTYRGIVTTREGDGDVGDEGESTPFATGSRSVSCSSMSGCGQRLAGRNAQCSVAAGISAKVAGYVCGESHARSARSSRACLQT